MLLRDDGLASAATLPTGRGGLGATSVSHCGTDCTAGEQLLERAVQVFRAVHPVGAAERDVH